MGMGITIQSLLDKIGKYDPKVFIHDKDIVLKSVLWLNSKQELFEPSSVYIMDYSFLAEHCCLDHNSKFRENVFILNENQSETVKVFKENPDANFIILKMDVDFKTLFNEIQLLFLKQQKYILGKAKLTDLFLSGCGIEELIDASFQILENPVIMTDTAFNLILNRQSGTVEDMMWNEAITRKSLPKDIIYTLNKEIYNNTIVKVQTPVITRLSFSRYNNLICDIEINNRIVAHIGVVDSVRPFGEEDPEFVSFLCKLIGTTYEKDSFYRNSSKMMLELFISNLLNGKIKDTDAIEESRKHFNIASGKNSAVLSIIPNEYDIDYSDLSYYRTHLEYILKNSQSVVFNNHIIFILNCNNDNLLSETAMKDLRAFLKKNRLRAGISRRIEGFEELEKYHKQSLDAIDLGRVINKCEYIYQYEEYSLFHLMKCCPVSSELREYCHPAVFTLMEYDRQNKTDFTQSLYVYLENSRNVTYSSEVLNIHRNSLIYRLEKISKIMSVSLEDNHVAFHIHYSYKILIYLGEVHFK